MGTYRLLLAALVALSHQKILLFNYNFGVVAVISFYLISGYVMALLVEKYYKNPFDPKSFYMDRAARLFPQYLFYFILSSLCIHLFRLDYISRPTPATWLLGAAILPTDFFMFWDDGKNNIIPQGWSLGLEMTFYMIVPWIIRYWSLRSVAMLMTMSLGVFMAGCADLIRFDWYGYHLLPGTLFIFLTGALFHTADRRRLYLLVFIYAFALVMFLLIFEYRFFYRVLYVREVLIGLLVGVPVFALLKDIKYSKFDQFLGNLSYGVFLNHILVIWMVDRFLKAQGRQTFLDRPQSGLLDIWQKDLAGPAICMIAISLALAFVSYKLVEEPVLKWRHKMRREKHS